MAIGNLYFAWVSDSETFNATTHARSDLQVLRFERHLSENSFPVATIEIKNPGSGILALGHPVTEAGSAVVTGGPRALVSYSPTPGAAWSPTATRSWRSSCAGPGRKPGRS